MCLYTLSDSTDTDQTIVMLKVLPRYTYLIEATQLTVLELHHFSVYLAYFVIKINYLIQVTD